MKCVLIFNLAMQGTWYFQASRKEQRNDGNDNS